MRHECFRVVPTRSQVPAFVPFPARRQNHSDTRPRLLFASSPKETAKKSTAFTRSTGNRYVTYLICNMPCHTKTATDDEPCRTTHRYLLRRTAQRNALKDSSPEVVFRSCDVAILEGQRTPLPCATRPPMKFHTAALAIVREMCSIRFAGLASDLVGPTMKNT
ncbi:uncharacterized protein B0I36DRAFT_49209 [Microdochium trichocladiopsis]|uniref:Uncharacterized protein n=1 Tax=Microdochium trichocladiopsis TaxID=1682393 RepID=A0A9P8XRT2_9PEZI|nr:uncharacterized protein B0I36DRAFT_49209 [Microdochium trichocladiopsis]KAH7014315.1 hypothetical protein B0I36DRAFT_49209 [Microdochium trichocladiopsis]